MVWCCNLNLIVLYFKHGDGNYSEKINKRENKYENSEKAYLSVDHPWGTACDLGKGSGDLEEPKARSSSGIKENAKRMGEKTLLNLCIPLIQIPSSIFLKMK